MYSMCRLVKITCLSLKEKQVVLITIMKSRPQTRAGIWRPLESRRRRRAARRNDILFHRVPRFSFGVNTKLFTLLINSVYFGSVVLRKISFFLRDKIAGFLWRRHNKKNWFRRETRTRSHRVCTSGTR